MFLSYISITFIFKIVNNSLKKQYLYFKNVKIFGVSKETQKAQVNDRAVFQICIGKILFKKGSTRYKAVDPFISEG